MVLLGETVVLAQATLNHDINANICDNLNESKDKNAVTEANAKKTDSVKEDNTQTKPYKFKLVWRNILGFVYLYSYGLWGFYLGFTSCKLATVLFGIFLLYFSGIGITGGAHRLWAHRTYKAKWPARLILMIAQTTAFQNHIYEWVRDHRVHHKFTDTDADPHNSTRGFFFSHIGWLLVRKHPDVRNKGATIDMSDIDRDPIAAFQKKYYLILMPIFCFVLPTLIPYYCWGETFSNSWYYCGVFRYIFSLNGTWLINSAAHIYGDKPYDKSISPTDSHKLAFFTHGEGFHNYHHTFPWDYKAGELGSYNGNITTAVIDFFTYLGWAYDLKTVPADMILRRVLRTGDGNHILSREYKNKENEINETTETEFKHDNNIWGWDDPDMDKDEIAKTQIQHRVKEKSH